jgi:magnesium-transporting ATPase (P-type)
MELDQKLDKHEISVYRGSNISQAIDYKELVVGDIFRFSNGSIIPADSIIIEG